MTGDRTGAVYGGVIFVGTKLVKVKVSKTTAAATNRLLSAQTLKVNHSAAYLVVHTSNCEDLQRTPAWDGTNLYIVSERQLEWWGTKKFVRSGEDGMHLH